jgi:stringent starvation protein B
LQRRNNKNKDIAKNTNLCTYMLRAMAEWLNSNGTVPSLNSLRNRVSKPMTIRRLKRLSTITPILSLNVGKNILKNKEEQL